MTLHFAPALDTHSSGFSHVALASSQEMNSRSKAAMRKSEFTQSDMSCNKPFLAKNRTWFVQILIFVTFVSSLTSFAIPRSPWDASPSKLQDVQHYEGSQENGGFRIGISLQKGSEELLLYLRFEALYLQYVSICFFELPVNLILPLYTSFHPWRHRGCTQSDCSSAFSGATEGWRGRVPSDGSTAAKHEARSSYSWECCVS